jgi:hypothetical protein
MKEVQEPSRFWDGSCVLQTESNVGMKELYVFSGLGADERVFKHLDLSPGRPDFTPAFCACGKGNSGRWTFDGSKPIEGSSGFY